MSDLDLDVSFMGKEAGHGPFILLAWMTADVTGRWSQQWWQWLTDSEAPVCGRDSMSLASYFGRIVEAQARACFFPVIF